jgi:hypothetical protein
MFWRMSESIEQRLIAAGCPPILNRRDLTKVLPFAKNSVQKMLADGVFPAMKLRGRWVVFRSDLAKWLASNLTTTSEINSKKESVKCP